MLWGMNLADGTRDLTQIARDSGLAPAIVATAAADLEKKGLIKKI